LKFQEFLSSLHIFELAVTISVAFGLSSFRPEKAIQVKVVCQRYSSCITPVWRFYKRY